MRPLKDILPANANKVLYIFYDFEYTQIKTYSGTAKEHEPNLVCVQQFVQIARKSKTVESILNDVVREGNHLEWSCKASVDVSVWTPTLDTIKLWR